jgi:serine/threonine-protein kinase HipA
MRRIEVYADWVGLDGPLMLGVLRAGQLRDKEIFSFEYEKEWLTSRHVLSVDPGRG